MQNKRTLTILVIIIVIFSGISSLTGILTKQGPGVYEYETIRGKTVEIYGKGVYQHMTADVAIQGIAQDYVTFFLAIPFLLFALWWYRKGSLKGHFLLAGILGYFFVTYLFPSKTNYNTLWVGKSYIRYVTIDNLITVKGLWQCFSFFHVKNNCYIKILLQ